MRSEISDLKSQDPLLHRRLRSLAPFHRELERGTADELGDCAAADALRADQHRSVRSTADGDAQPLQVWLKLPASDAGHFGTNAAEVFRFTACGHPISHYRFFATNFALLRHRNLKLFDLK